MNFTSTHCDFIEANNFLPQAKEAINLNPKRQVASSQSAYRDLTLSLCRCVAECFIKLGIDRFVPRLYVFLCLPLPESRKLTVSLSAWLDFFAVCPSSVPRVFGGFRYRFACFFFCGKEKRGRSIMRPKEYDNDLKESIARRKEMQKAARFSNDQPTYKKLKINRLDVTTIY